MATAIRGTGAAYDVRATGEHRTGFGGPLGSLTGFGVDTARGACSGLLALIGGVHMTGTATSAAVTGAGWQSITSVAEMLSSGGFAGPAELIGGAALFLTTRRPLARMMGLLAFIAFIAAYANGYSINDMILALSGVLERASGILQSLPVADSA
jgi:hypothetical protein